MQQANALQRQWLVGWSVVTLVVLVDGPSRSDSRWGLSLLFTSMLLVGIWRGRLCADSVFQRQGYVVCHKLCICPSQVPNDAFHAKVEHLLVQLLICWLMGYWQLTLQAFRVMHVGGALCRWRRSL